MVSVTCNGPKIQKINSCIPLVRHKNVTAGRSQSFLVGHKHPCDRPKTNVIARPSHALCWTNAVQWRGRYFNGDIGSAVQRSVFKQMSWCLRFYQSCNVSKLCHLHCVMEHQFHTCRDRRHPVDLGNNIWHCSPLPMSIFGAHLTAWVCDTVNLILMSILHYWFEFSPQHGQSQCNAAHMAFLVADTSYFSLELASLFGKSMKI